MFENKLLKCNGQAFEDLFCQLMKCKYSGFQHIGTWGKQGDQKRDAIHFVNGDYYCIYGPNDVSDKNTMRNAKTKIKKDIEGCIDKWEEKVKCIKYVINTKNNDSVPPFIIDIIEDYNKELDCKIELLTSTDIKKIFRDLSLSDKQMIVGWILEPSNELLTFNIIQNIMKHIEKYPKSIFEEKMIPPKFDKKIKINKLSTIISDILINGYHDISIINEFFAESDYDKEELRDRLNSIYINAKQNILEKNIYENNTMDMVFIAIYDELLYNKESRVVSDGVIAIMTAFFESCDIFEI